VPELEQLLKKYPDKVKLVFKNFPIRSHKYAVKAAAAALAAEREEKFWEFHDMLFENYNRLNDQKIQEIVGLLGLDEIEFKKQQQNPTVTERIRQDYEEGIRVGVRGTPTVFINGKKVRDRSMRQMETIIEKELQKQKQENKQKAAE
jgi:protein-disulfide isomerase